MRVYEVIVVIDFSANEADNAVNVIASRNKLDGCLLFFSLLVGTRLRCLLIALSLSSCLRRPSVA